MLTAGDVFHLFGPGATGEPTDLPCIFAVQLANSGDCWGHVRGEGACCPFIDRQCVGCASWNFA